MKILKLALIFIVFVAAIFLVLDRAIFNHSVESDSATAHINGLGTEQAVKINDDTIPTSTKLPKHKSIVPTKHDLKIEKAELRQEILALVNKKNFSKIRKHNSYNDNNVLTQQERIAIETVLNIDKYKKQVNITGVRRLEYLKKRVKNMTFNSIDEISAIRQVIQDIITNYPKN